MMLKLKLRPLEEQHVLTFMSMHPSFSFSNFYFIVFPLGRKQEILTLQIPWNIFNGDTSSQNTGVRNAEQAPNILSDLAPNFKSFKMNLLFSNNDIHYHFNIFSMVLILIIIL